ncbi:MAG: hypothetical protein P8X55_14440, partial [Desulfosarcinaceae bacterium]
CHGITSVKVALFYYFRVSSYVPVNIDIGHKDATGGGWELVEGLILPLWTEKNLDPADGFMSYTL